MTTTTPLPAPRHVKIGLVGYGPDLDETDEPITDWETLCDAIRDELNRSADYLVETAPTYADSLDFESAYTCRTMADDLANLAVNFDWDTRLVAPLYEGDEHKLAATMADLIAGHFPIYVDAERNQRLYVWDVTE